MARGSVRDEAFLSPRAQVPSPPRAQMSVLDPWTHALLYALPTQRSQGQREPTSPFAPLYQLPEDTVMLTAASTTGTSVLKGALQRRVFSLASARRHRYRISKTLVSGGFQHKASLFVVTDLSRRGCGVRV